LVHKTQDTMVTKDQRSTNRLPLLLFPRSFVLLLPVALNELCLLHKVRAQSYANISNKTDSCVEILSFTTMKSRYPY